MALLDQVKTDITDIIKANGVEAITGNVLGTDVLANILVAALGAYHFGGVAVPATNPGSPDTPRWYLATAAGTYTYFGSYALTAGALMVVKWDGTSWNWTLVADFTAVGWDIIMGNFQIKELGDGVLDDDAATVGQMNTAIELVASKYLGTYVSLAALQSAFPDPGGPGFYANVDAGVGTDVVRYIWDDDDAAYVLMGSGGTGLNNIVEDLTPQLGGDLDANGHTIAGRNVATDGSKLDNIEANADITDKDNIASSIHGITEKPTPIDADEFPLIDTAASNVLKLITWANIKVTLKAYFDTIYAVAAGVFVLASNTLDDITDGTTYKRMSATEQSKLGGIEAGADVTDATNVDAAGATMNADTDVKANGWVIDEDTMASDLDTKVPTQQSVKAYVASEIASVVGGGVTFEGDYDADTNTPDLDSSPSGIIKGEMYVTSVAGLFFGATSLEVGDMLISRQDNPTAKEHWAIIQGNILFTALQIKTMYESNSDTNAFTDALLSKLNGIAASANNYVHPNHSGDVTSTADGATVIAPSAISGKANLVSPAGTETTLALDGATLKEVTLQAIANLAPAMNLDLDTKSIIETGTAGEILTIGLICYLKSDGKYWVASNAALATASPALRMSLWNSAADDPVSLLKGGKITTIGLTAGAVYYLGTAGAITATKPTSVGEIIRVIGTAESTTVLVVEIDNFYTVVAASGGLGNVVEDTTPEQGGQLVSHDFSYLLSELTASGKYNGLVRREDVYLISSPYFGQLLYWEGASGKYWEADASTGLFCSAINTGSGTTGTNDVLLQGFIRYSGWSFTTGVFLYLGESGAISETPANSMYQIVGIAITPTIIYFNPQPPESTSRISALFDSIFSLTTNKVILYRNGTTWAVFDASGTGYLKFTTGTPSLEAVVSAYFTDDAANTIYPSDDTFYIFTLRKEYAKHADPATDWFRAPAFNLIRGGATYTEVLSGSTLGVFTFRGTDDSSVSHIGAQIVVIAQDDYSASVFGAKLEIRTIAQGESTEAVRLEVDEFGDVNISGNLGLKTATFNAEVDNGIKTTDFSVLFINGQKQKATLTANPITLTFDTTTLGVANYLLKLVNGGLATLTWAAETGTITWLNGGTAPTLSSSGTDFIAVYFDGTNFFCAWSPAY